MGGIRSKEHFLALQRRKNTLIANDDNDQAIVSNNNSGMQTLGAKNEFTRNTRQRSTLDTKRPSKGPAPNPPPNQYGIPNPSFNGNESDNDNDNSIDDAHATTMNLSIYGANNTNINNTRNHRRTTNFRQKNRNSDLNSEL